MDLEKRLYLLRTRVLLEERLFKPIEKMTNYEFNFNSLTIPAYDELKSNYDNIQKLLRELKGKIDVKALFNYLSNEKNPFKKGIVTSLLYLKNPNSLYALEELNYPLSLSFLELTKEEVEKYKEVIPNDPIYLVGCCSYVKDGSYKVDMFEYLYEMPLESFLTKEESCFFFFFKNEKERLLKLGFDEETALSKAFVRAAKLKEKRKC